MRGMWEENEVEVDDDEEEKEEKQSKKTDGGIREQEEADEGGDKMFRKRGMINTGGQKEKWSRMKGKWKGSKK